MARLVPGQPVETTEPVIVVDALPAGAHRIQLVVINQRGQRSEPDVALVTVSRGIIRPVDPIPGPLDPRPIPRPRPIGRVQPLSPPLVRPRGTREPGEPETTPANTAKSAKATGKTARSRKRKKK